MVERDYVKGATQRTVTPAVVAHLAPYPQPPQQVLAEDLPLEQTLLDPARQRELECRFLPCDTSSEEGHHDARRVVDVDRRGRRDLDDGREAAGVAGLGGRRGGFACSARVG